MDTEVTYEGSAAEYDRLLKNPPEGPDVPFKPLRRDPYAIDGKSAVAIVRTDDRREGIKEGLRLLGGVERLCEGVEGDILIKPNCNRGDPFPFNTHPETVGAIAESLIEIGFPPGRIVVGEMSGRSKGLPTRHTMEKLGLKKVADDLGIRVSCFDEEEEWVTVKPPARRWWPDGVKIPRRIYEADRIILAPVMDRHPGEITFSLGLKLGVGVIDAAGREWLHNGEAFIDKAVEINLAFSADLVVMDGMSFSTAPSVAGGTKYVPRYDAVIAPGVIVLGSNRVAADAVAAAIMKHYGSQGMAEKPVREYRTIKIGEERGLGSSKLENMMLKTLNLAEDEGFQDVIQKIERELR